MSQRGPAGRRAGHLIGALAALAGLGAGGPGPRLDRPLSLTDPVRGTEEALEAGAPLLHVVFFATWCKPCLDELRPLAEIEASWGDRGYRLVVVAVATRQSAERLAAFARSSRPPGRLLWDRDGAAARALAVDRLPAHLLFGPRGELLFRAPSLEEGVAAAIEQRLGNLSRGRARP